MKRFHEIYRKNYGKDIIYIYLIRHPYQLKLNILFLQIYYILDMMESYK